MVGPGTGNGNFSSSAPCGEKRLMQPADGPADQYVPAASTAAPSGRPSSLVRVARIRWLRRRPVSTDNALVGFPGLSQNHRRLREASHTGDSATPQRESQTSSKSLMTASPCGWCNPPLPHDTDCAALVRLTTCGCSRTPGCPST